MAYLLDANVFIQAKNLHYGFDFCPAFWDWIVEKNRHARVFSVSQVGNELGAGQDELANWAGSRGDAFFLETDQSALSALAQVSQWVVSQRYEPAAINTFLQVADYYLIGYALAHGHTVVTHEIPADTRRRIKIPNVCVGLDISCLSPYEMLRRERARFVLGQ